jgi:DNA polymerase-3 subunit delta'
MSTGEKAMSDDEVASHWPRAPLPWQTETWQRLVSLLHADTLPHAILAAGPQNIGKQNFLSAFAGMLLCEDSSGGVACDKCRTCHLLDVGTHPDIMMVSTEEDSRVIKIDQIRKVLDFASKTPGISQRKVILIGPAEVMNLNAANALLKCLEEPTDSTTLLLFSHQPSTLLATLRSRCQTLAMGLPSHAQSMEWLEQVTGSAQISEQLLEVSNQRPLLAKDYFLQDKLEQQLSLRRGVDELLRGGISPLEFPQVVSELELVDVLALLQSRLETSLRASVVDGSGAYARAGFVLRDELARLQQAVSRGANPNRQLTIEDCAAQLVRAVGAGAA